MQHPASQFGVGGPGVQGCASHPQPGGRFPQIWQFSKTGVEEGFIFENLKFYMTHFGPIKLESFGYYNKLMVK